MSCEESCPYLSFCLDQQLAADEMKKQAEKIYLELGGDPDRDSGPDEGEIANLEGPDYLTGLSLSEAIPLSGIEVVCMIHEGLRDRAHNSDEQAREAAKRAIDQSDWAASKFSGLRNEAIIKCAERGPHLSRHMLIGKKVVKCSAGTPTSDAMYFDLATEPEPDLPA